MCIKPRPKSSDTNFNNVYLDGYKMRGNLIEALHVV